MQTDMERLMEDAEETFGEAGESDAAGNYADGVGDGEVYKMEIEGDNGAALNGKITSIFLADNSFVLASSKEE